ncbi:MAG: hypothetical protein ACOCYE_06080 [Pseudomonadota bacterium]
MRTEIGLLALAVAALAPLLAWQVLERSLPAMTVTLAVPRTADAAALERALDALGELAPRTTVEFIPEAAVADLWASLRGPEAPAPLLLDVRLWPAGGLAADAVRGRVADSLPDAVVELDVGARPRSWTLWPLVGLWLALVLMLVVRVRRGVRRVLAAERDALTLLVAFGARPAQLGRLIADPLERRLVVTAAISGAVGGASGLAGLLASRALAWTSLANWPWLVLWVAALLAILLAPMLTLLVGRRVVRHRLRLAMVRPA